MKKINKEERSWIFYDIGNSAYILTVATVLFPILFMNIATNSMSETDASSLTQVGKAVYSIVIAFLAPILGTIGDYQGLKKRLFITFVLLGISGALLMTLPIDHWSYLLVFYIVASIGYAGANVFYDAFLVDVTTEERYNKISSYGYAFGYIGSIIPFILGFIFFLVAHFDVLPMKENTAIRIAFLIAIIWWILFTIPLLKNVHQKFYIPKEQRIITSSFKRLYETFKDIKKYRNAFLFLLAYFFYIDAVYTIITAAVPIGKALNIVDDVTLIGIVLVIQLIAFPSAIIYSKLAERFSEKRMLYTGIFIYIIITALGITMHATWQMWLLAILVGLAQGGIQAISRSYFSRMIPKDKVNEFFGLFNVFGTFSSIIGPFLVILFTQLTDSANLGMIGLLPLLILGGFFLTLVKEEV